MKLPCYGRLNICLAAVVVSGIISDPLPPCHIGHPCLLCNAQLFILSPYLCRLHVILKGPLPYGL